MGEPVAVVVCVDVVVDGDGPVIIASSEEFELL